MGEAVSNVIHVHFGPSAEECYAQACQLDEDAKTLSDAERLYERAVRLEPRYVEAHINLGNVRHRLGRLDAAEMSFRTALYLEPRNKLALYNLACTLDDLGKGVQAIDLFQEVLSIDETYADAHYNLARVLEARGCHREARPHWQRYVVLAPKTKWAKSARKFLGRPVPNLGWEGAS